MIRNYGWLPLMLLVALCGCRRQGESVSSLMERQEKLASEVDALKRSVSDLRRTYMKEIDAKEADFDDFAAQVRMLNQTADSIRSSMEQFAAYKHSYRKHARAKAPGTELGDVVVGSQTYRNAKVREITDTYLALTHQNGTSRIPLAQAPPALQDLVAFDPLLDAVVAQASGTGTDWLLSAMDAAQRVLASNPPQTGGGKVVAATGTANRGTGVAAAPATAPPVYAPPTYASTTHASDVPAWRRFSNFTGSFWAPLQNRRRSGASVNTYSPGYFSTD